MVRQSAGSLAAAIKTPTTISVGIRALARIMPKSQAPAAGWPMFSVQPKAGVRFGTHNRVSAFEK